MVSKIKIMLVLLLVPIVTSNFSCNPSCAVVNYSFAITSHFYPDTDSIHVGDTIWIVSDTTTRLVNQLSGTEVDYSGAENLGMAVQFRRLSDATHSDVTEAALSFDHVVTSGQYIKAEQFETMAKNYRFKETGGRYQLLVGFIPKEKGDFMLASGDAAGVYRKKQQCDKAGFSITITDTDQHLYLYEQSRPGYELSQYERTHAYCVRVK